MKLLASFRYIVFASFLVALAGSAHASGKAFADQGNNYPGDGQDWPLTLTQAGPTQSLPFLVDVGNGPASLSFFTSSDGSVHFANGDYINVALASEAWTPTFAISNDRGRLDPSLIDSTLAPNFSADPDVAGLDSYRFLWNGVCPQSDPNCTNSFTFEANIVYLTPESFVLLFNYGSGGSPIEENPLSGVTVGYSLGTNSDAILSEGTVDGPGPDFCFSNGVARTFTTIAACQGTTTTNPNPVPEPDVRSLLLLGGLLIAASAALRSRRRTQRASI